MAIRSANSSKGRISSCKYGHKLYKTETIKSNELHQLSATDAASGLKTCEKHWWHLKALLLGPPFYKHILVKETFGLVPDSSISSVHWQHISSMPHLADVQMRICLLYSGLSCKGKRIKSFHQSVTVVWTWTDRKHGPAVVLEDWIWAPLIHSICENTPHISPNILLHCFTI